MANSALITGASGYTGARLAKKLLHEGWIVHVVVRPSSNLALLTDVIDQVRVHCYQGTTDSMLRIVGDAKPDIAIHLASFASVTYRSQDIHAMLHSNVIFGTDLLEAMVFHKVHSLINTGTFSQHYDNRPYNPNSLYAASKQAFEDIALYYLESSPLRCITLTLFDSYGPQDPRNKIVNLLYRAYVTGEPLATTPGEQLLDMVYIDDVVQAYALAASRLLQGTAEPHEKYAVSSRNPLTLRQLVALFEEEAGAKLKVEWGAKPYRAREIMVPWTEGSLLPDWHPQVDIRTGIKLYLADKGCAP